MLLSLCIEQYLEDCYALAEATRRLYRVHLERLLRVVGDVAVGELGAESLRQFFDRLRRRDGAKYSASFQDQVYRTLATFFRWCVRQGIVALNPMAAVRRPRVPRRKSPRLSSEEIERLLRAVGETEQPRRNLAIICLMLDSGLRRGEVLNLRLSDVDLTAGVARVFGKDKEEREVPMGRFTIAALRSYLAIRPQGSSALFVTVDGSPLSASGLQSLMRRLRLASGLCRLHCHLLRHTFANYYIDNGGGLRLVQKILGHSDVSLTARLYTDPELRAMKDEHGRVSPLAARQEVNDS